MIAARLGRCCGLSPEEVAHSAPTSSLLSDAAAGR
jgi:hypothetical protein